MDLTIARFEVTDAPVSDELTMFRNSELDLLIVIDDEAQIIKASLERVEEARDQLREVRAHIRFLEGLAAWR